MVAGDEGLRRRRSDRLVEGPAVVGEGTRLAFTPCHRSPIRFQDGRQLPVGPVQVRCPRRGERWTVEFPAVDPGEEPLALWRPLR